ncbi:PTS system mannose-specific transporter subunit IID [Klebsiella pneumoniae]|uniref:PTS system mannose-specific transporter subunit IID n=1 Tax=Klebsiella pneumoniae TaxID=573 RepID=A0A2X3FBL6_KLEPN|nr:PTS system mannose-specific transporter subunit IID [Klebsiella pneumoniae]
MGPLAGVGDPIFWGTVRPVFAALGAGIAMSGSLLGPLLFFILFNAVRLLTRYYGVAYGYRKGVDIVKDMGGGFLQKLTEGASILGLFVMGALVNKWTHVNIPMVVSKITGSDGQVHVTTVQTILDQLMPGLVPLLLTFACMWLLRKKVNPLWIIVGFFVIGIAGYAVGLLVCNFQAVRRGLAPGFFLSGETQSNDLHGPGDHPVYPCATGLRDI